MILERTRLLAAAAALTVGCGDGGWAAPGEVDPAGRAPAAEPAETSGSLSFALTLQDGIEFDAFSYAVTGPNFSKSGQIDVSNSRTVSELIGGIPVGSGYSITLMGTSAPPNRATCSGSATFGITAGAVTEVYVSISCRLDEQPAPVPVPPLAPVALGFILLAIGSASARRRHMAPLRQSLARADHDRHNDHEPR
jgi:hypothetical protein